MSDETTHRDQTAIIGIGQTDYSRDSGRSDLTLAMQASMAAIEDAGLTRHDIDGIVRCDMDLVKPQDLMHGLRLDNVGFWAEVSPGGVAPAGMIGAAVSAVVSGMAKHVLVWRSLNGRSGRRYGQAPPSGVVERVGGSGSYDEFFGPYGMNTAGHPFAMIAQRHMIEYGTTEKQLGAIPVACRNRALANPRAQMYGRPLSLDDYLAARWIARPLRLNDFCLETDGAAAVIVSAVERAHDRPKPPALIRAVAQATPHAPQPANMFPVLWRESITDGSAQAVAKALYRRAGMGPEDIDVAQLYDCFSITVLLQLEDYGFCAKGEGGPFAASGAIELGGRLPINTGGGHLSEGYIHGMGHIVEGVKQIRGESTSQVPGAETCLVTSTALPPGSALILRKAS
jgi:acetyl-CoA acetyltransferase